MLFKIHVDSKTKAGAEGVIKKSKDKIIKATKNYIIVEACGDENHIKALLSNLEKYEISQMTRTGRIAMGLD